jgi:hypothetical protein
MPITIQFEFVFTHEIISNLNFGYTFDQVLFLECC